MGREGRIASKFWREKGRWEYDTSRYPENWSARATRRTEPAEPIIPSNHGGALDGWSKVADRFAFSIGKRVCEDIEGDSDQMKKFVTDAMRGFGAFDFPLGVGSFGIDLARAANRESQQRKHDIFRLGHRFPVAHRR